MSKQGPYKNPGRSFDTKMIDLCFISTVNFCDGQGQLFTT